MGTTYSDKVAAIEHDLATIARMQKPGGGWMNLRFGTKEGEGRASREVSDALQKAISAEIEKELPAILARVRAAIFGRLVAAEQSSLDEFEAARRHRDRLVATYRLGVR